MRTASFRDDVLWAIAYKLGLDPATPDQQNFQPDQAAALVSYINPWVRRTFDAIDWPEWTDTQPFDVGAGHIVPWRDNDAGIQLARVFKVYLVDPATTDVPVDIEFRETPLGIYVGTEHGDQVWIKFQLEAPKFSSEEWDPVRTYNAGDVTYLSVTGECYRSIGNNNRGNYPGPVGRRQPMIVQVTQPSTERDQGNPIDRPKIMELALITDISIPDPHPAGGIFTGVIHDSTGAILSVQTYTVPSTMSLATILTNWGALFQGDPGLAGFTITVDTGRKVIRFQDDSDFTITRPDGIDPAVYFHDPADNQHLLKNYVIQPFVPTLSPVEPMAQLTMLTLGTGQALPGQVYSVTFIDQAGATHEVQYTAKANDGPIQILTGLANAMGAATSTDPFFLDTATSIDPNAPSLTISNRYPANVDATMQRPGPLPPDPIPPVPVPPSFWTYVPFPLALVDQVVRGAYGDALKEAGQTDKGAGEEQAVPSETQVRTGATLAPPYDTLTDQQQSKPRYAIK